MRTPQLRRDESVRWLESDERLPLDADRMAERERELARFISAGRVGCFCPPPCTAPAPAAYFDIASLALFCIKCVQRRGAHPPALALAHGRCRHIRLLRRPHIKLLRGSSAIILLQNVLEWARRDARRRS